MDHNSGSDIASCTKVRILCEASIMLNQEKEVSTWILHLNCDSGTGGR